MNILVLSDRFSQGGLETHIDTMYEQLKENNKVIFAFSSYDKNKYLKKAEVIEGFNFKLNSSIKEFCSDVNRLVNIIKENKIDIVHVHPFYCIFPALFAANITKTKIVYTYHGRMSLNFITSFNEQILYYFAIENIFNKIFCVAEDAIPWFNNFKKNQAVFFPNILDETKYKKHKIINNKKWALLSRLDNDKKDEIEKVIRYLPELDIETIDIYGSGSEEESLKQLVEEMKLQKKVNFFGYKEDIFKCLNNNYNGILGLGRVAIEALTMNYPVILIGYGKICGVIDESILKKISKKNFVTTEIPEITKAQLKEQLGSIYADINHYQFRDIMVKDFGKNRINDYIEEINAAEYSNISLVNSIFEDINSLENQEEEFYTSYNVFLLLAKLSNYSKNIDLKSSINIYQKIFSLNFNYFSLQQTQNNIEKKVIENKEKIENVKLNIDKNQLSIEEILKDQNNIKDTINNEKKIITEQDKKIEKLIKDINMLEKKLVQIKNRSFLNVIKRIVKRK